MDPSVDGYGAWNPYVYVPKDQRHIFYELRADAAASPAADSSGALTCCELVREQMRRIRHLLDNTKRQTRGSAPSTISLMDYIIDAVSRPDVRAAQLALNRWTDSDGAVSIEPRVKQSASLKVMEEHKSRGNALFSRKDWEGAARAYTQAMMSGALLAVYPDAAGTSRAPPVRADAQHAPPAISTPSLMNGAKTMVVDSSDMLPLGTILRYAIISPLSLRHLSYGCCAEQSPC